MPVAGGSPQIRKAKERTTWVGLINADAWLSARLLQPNCGTIAFEKTAVDLKSIISSK